MSITRSLLFAGNRFFMFIFQSMALIGALVLLLNVGPYLELRYFPVLSNQSVHNVSRSGDEVRFFIDFDKDRDCYIASLNWFGRAGPHYFPVDVVVGPNDRPIRPIAKYPTGRIITGPYTAVIPKAVDNERIDTIEGSLAYYCHPFWLTLQRFGPVAVPNP